MPRLKGKQPTNILHIKMQIKMHIKTPWVKGNHPPTFRMPTEIKNAHTPMQDAHHISHAYGKKNANTQGKSPNKTVAKMPKTKWTTQLIKPF